LGIQVGPT
jgi:hypothetical protein